MENKSIKEIKDEVAIKNRWLCGFDITTILESGTTDLEYIIDEAMKEYANQQVAELKDDLIDALKYGNDTKGMLISCQSGYQELKRENSELKIQIESILKMDNKIVEYNKTIAQLREEIRILNNAAKSDMATIKYLESLKSKADELCEVLDSLMDWNNKYPPNRVYSYGMANTIEKAITDIVAKAKQALENYKR